MHTATIADLTADRVFYRDLEPCDPRLPGLSTLREQLGLPAGRLPRKRDPEYGRIALALARAAQAQAGGPHLRHILVIGDTDNDRNMATALAELGDLAAFGFIGVDQLDAPPELRWEGPIASANRWSLLERWADEVAERGARWPSTAVLIDIDKTLLGPRGRNDPPVDAARAEGALAVAGQLLGDQLDVAGFRATYAELCRKSWHRFTLDNQDYVATTAVLAAAGAIALADLSAAIDSGAIPNITTLLAALAGRVPPALAALHADLSARIAAGDPTPFKAFRRAELAQSVARMRAGEITLCRELFTLARGWAAQGALLMAASDKPAESAIPTAEQAAAGITPLHRTPANVG